uniref:Uncharacterized protein n=1 Tax=Oryza punctata TaxID=4537 RepID=A0A0E0MM23_ORYPU
MPPPGDLIPAQDGYFVVDWGLTPPSWLPTPPPGDLVPVQDGYFVVDWVLTPLGRLPTPPPVLPLPGDVVNLRVFIKLSTWGLLWGTRLEKKEEGESATKMADVILMAIKTLSPARVASTPLGPHCLDHAAPRVYTCLCSPPELLTLRPWAKSPCTGTLHRQAQLFASGKSYSPIWMVGRSHFPDPSTYCLDRLLHLPPPFSSSALLATPIHPSIPLLVLLPRPHAGHHSALYPSMSL